MPTDWITVIGLVAATSVTISFLPQVIKSWRTQKTEGISLWMYILFVFGVLLWLVYGLLVKDLPIILGNSVTFILAGSVLLLKIKYRNRD